MYAFISLKAAQFTDMLSQFGSLDYAVSNIAIKYLFTMPLFSSWHLYCVEMILCRIKINL